MTPTQETFLAVMYLLAILSLLSLGAALTLLIRKGPHR